MNDIETIINSYQPGNEATLIPLLQKIQERFRYIPPEAISMIAQQTGYSESQVYGVASFYSLFRFSQPGKHSIRICSGTACHVRHSTTIKTAFEYELGIKSGQTTHDGRFDLDTVACFGCCALGPVVTIDGQIYAQVTPTKARKLLKQYED
jgi:NADH-quinone oxidoreductase subunit E